jgi:hypothetical protein
LALNQGQIMGFGQAITAGFSNYTEFPRSGIAIRILVLGAFCASRHDGAYALDAATTTAIGGLGLWRHTDLAAHMLATSASSF